MLKFHLSRDRSLPSSQQGKLENHQRTTLMRRATRMSLTGTKSRKDGRIMQSQLKTSERSRAHTTGSGLASSQQERKRATQRKGKRNFASWDPEVQRETFLNWLPKELLDAPGINWTQLSPNIMRYCITTIEDSPDAAVLAVAAASMRDIDQVSQQSALKQANQLLRELRATGQVQNLSNLRQEEIWYEWAERQQKSMRGKSLVNGYAALAVCHMPRYLHLASARPATAHAEISVATAASGLEREVFSLSAVRCSSKSETKVRNGCAYSSLSSLAATCPFAQTAR